MVFQVNIGDDSGRTGKPFDDFGTLHSVNIINGGVHAKNNLDIQEFMIRPEKASSFSEAIRRSFLVIQNLKGMIDNTNVGDEGGFSPNFQSSEEAIKIIVKAIEKSGFKPG